MILSWSGLSVAKATLPITATSTTANTEKIILIHFVLVVVGADDKLLDSELKMVNQLISALGFNEEENKTIQSVFFRSQGNPSRAKDAAQDLTNNVPSLKSDYEEIFQTFHIANLELFIKSG